MFRWLPWQLILRLSTDSILCDFQFVVLKEISDEERLVLFLLLYVGGVPSNLLD